MSKEIFKKKQDWLDAVMASDLNAATKVFAFGIFKHMYGIKEWSNPGTEALEAVTNQHRSKFSAHRKALKAAGFIDHDEPGRGKVYTYTLTYLYPEGTTSCTQKEHELHPEGTRVVPTGNTNTTSNTPTKTNKSNTSKSASAPVDSPLKEDIPQSILSQEPSFEDVVSSLKDDPRFSFEESACAESPIPRDPATPSQHRSVRERALAEKQEKQALQDLGIDPEGEW